MGRVLIVLFILSASTLSAQKSLPQLEKHLAKLFDSLDRVSPYSDVEVLNDSIYQCFASMMKIKGSLTYPYNALRKARFEDCISSDGKVRLISWDTRGGGTMESWNVICQYIGQDGQTYVQNIKNNDREDYDQALHFSIVSPLANNRYIALGTGKYDTRIRADVICNFNITPHGIVDTDRIFWIDSPQSKIYSEFSIFKDFSKISSPTYKEDGKELCFTMTEYDEAKDINIVLGNICLFYQNRFFKKQSKRKLK